MESPTARKLVATDASLDCLAILTVPEQLVRPFTFYLNDRLRQGMFYDRELYELVQEFHRDDRLIAYQSVINLSAQGHEVLITVSRFRYRSWISLRSPGYQHVVKADWLRVIVW